MALIVLCACGTRLRPPESAAGKKVKCPKCGGAVAVPAPAPQGDDVDEEAPTRPLPLAGCPGCGEPPPARANFCPQCGRRLKP